MNAYQIMGFLLLLNLSLSGMSLIAEVTGGNFYDVSSAGSIPDEYNIEDIEQDSFSPLEILVTSFGAQGIIAAVAGAIAGTVVTYATRIPADSAYAYSLFSSFYVVYGIGTLTLIWSFTENANELVNWGIFILVAIFTVILSVSFVSFFVQLIKGGWSTYL